MAKSPAPKGPANRSWNGATTREDQRKRFHERANHEDSLHISRTAMFISFNGFLAIAVGLVPDDMIKRVFVVMVLIVDFIWGLWAPNARRFIRALRDAGGQREDEQLWKDTVGPMETRFSWITDPLTIISVYVPWGLFGGWLVILAYYLLLKGP